METRLCRICGKLGPNFFNIFRTEGLKNKIETCLPIIVSESLLPDTICGECLDNVDNFYNFIKNCLQNIIILEAQYDIHESCLKTKRKHEKAIQANVTLINENKLIQTDDYLDLLFGKSFDEQAYPLTNSWIKSEKGSGLVDYEVQSDSDCDDGGNNGKVIVTSTFDSVKVDGLVDKFLNNSNKRYFDDPENDFISEITQRKRKADTIGNSCTKIFKTEGGSRRKSRQPKRLLDHNDSYGQEQYENGTNLENNYREAIPNLLPQSCLLCERQVLGPAALAAHVFEVHGIDMADIYNKPSSPIPSSPDKKRKLPNLVKITDLRRSEEPFDSEEPPKLLPSFPCSSCPVICISKPELYSHMKSDHRNHSAYLCSACLFQATSYTNLQNHVETCIKTHPVTNKYFCTVCLYGDDNFKALENHVLVHEFLIDLSRKQAKIFDPADYIDSNDQNERTLHCSECGMEFDGFKEFSTHRRSQHSIFHCDLCNKFYGRNSHLWKHVNRLHKGHPSITCQLCYKTSASKYHLAQHFNKIHSQKFKGNDKKDFLMQKFESYDFNSVKQSMLRQSLLEQSETEELSQCKTEDDNAEAPKEIDSSSNLYTNIITNYTPPVNEGQYKCPKCAKGFHKRVLLKKHKKNCRPRLQKDLLTRCKSCARIFKDRQSLSKHLVNYHSEYVCEICSQKVQSKCEIVSHIRFNHPGCQLFCMICSNVLRSQGDLVEHLKDHLNSYVCQFCGDALPSKIKLKMHILSLHRKILSLSCGVCLKLFETQHILRDHVKLVHKEKLSPLTSCTVCGKNYGSKWKTFDHLNKSHGRIFKACKVCLEVFDTEALLGEHIEEAHNKVQVKAEIKAEMEASDIELDDMSNSNSNDEFKIEQAQKSLLEKRLTKDVKVKKYDEDQIHHSSKRTVYVNSNDPSYCEICFKTWPAKKHLWQHYIRCHKSVAATVCGICLKTNEDYATLQRHLVENHPTLLHGQGFGSNFICRICGRYHNASSKLRLHMAIHENFDWSLLDKGEIKNEFDNNGKMFNEDINYESLIEQVECSSTDEDDEDAEVKKEVSSSEEDDDDEEEDEKDEEEGRNSMEAEMLQNMLKEKQTVEEEESSSSSSSMISDSDSEASSQSDKYSSNSNSNQSAPEPATFDRKSAELDSAIKSISYECVKEENIEFEENFCELQNGALNENEIESAVDSIL